MAAKRSHCRVPRQRRVDSDLRNYRPRDCVFFDALPAGRRLQILPIANGMDRPSWNEIRSGGLSAKPSPDNDRGLFQRRSMSSRPTRLGRNMAFCSATLARWQFPWTARPCSSILQSSSRTGLPQIQQLLKSEVSMSGPPGTAGAILSPNDFRDVKSLSYTELAVPRRCAWNIGPVKFAANAA